LTAVTDRTARSGTTGPLFPIILFAALLGFGAFFDHEAETIASPSSPRADVARRVIPSPDVLRLAKWAVDTRDSAGLPFVVVDKTRARLFAFDSAGRMRGSTPVLLGASTGDDAAAAVTPAGRFVAGSAGQPATEDGIVWVNGAAAVELHAMPSERSPGRATQRLASRLVEDKRISDGSLHVSGEFYRQYLSALRNQGSVAYVLPEILPLQQVFSLLEAEPTRMAQSPRALWTRRPS